VGKRRLERALASDKVKSLGITVVVRWRPFFLDPTLPKAGVDKMERYRAKFPPAMLERMVPHMEAVGATEGIKFSYKGKIGNTRDSHRLIELAWAKGGASLQDRVVEALFHAYFEAEQNVGDNDVLLECAVKAGMDREEVSRALLSDAHGDEVDEEVAKWKHEEDVSGVPFFSIHGGLYTASGAQDPAFFVDALTRLAHRLRPEASASGAE
jgi:predicted DsbA family dithiol-disulfide isomerase